MVALPLAAVNATAAAAAASPHAALVRLRQRKAAGRHRGHPVERTARTIRLHKGRIETIAAQAGRANRRPSNRDASAVASSTTPAGIRGSLGQDGWPRRCASLGGRTWRQCELPDIPTAAARQSPSSQGCQDKVIRAERHHREDDRPQCTQKTIAPHPNQENH